jgi:hypothetical protein
MKKDNKTTKQQQKNSKKKKLSDALRQNLMRRKTAPSLSSTRKVEEL